MSAPLKVEDFHQRETRKKTWGWEEWIVNNDLYCGKKLHFTKDGGSTSLHFHKNKHETMYVEHGNFCIRVTDTATGRDVDHRLRPGQTIVIPPLTPHRIMCENISYEEGEAVLIEFSTHHEDSDSYRIML